MSLWNRGALPIEIGQALHLELLRASNLELHGRDWFRFERPSFTG